MADTIPVWESPRQNYTTETTVYNTDFERIEKNTMNLRNQFGPADTTAGGPSNYTVTIEDILSYPKNLSIMVEINQTNDGPVTINVNGLGAQSIKNYLGNAMSPGELPAGAYALLIHNGTEFRTFTPTINTVSVDHGIFGRTGSLNANQYEVVIPEITSLIEGLVFNLEFGQKQILTVNPILLRINGSMVAQLFFNNLDANAIEAGLITTLVYKAGVGFISIVPLGKESIESNPITTSQFPTQIGSPLYSDSVVEGIAPEFIVKGGSVVQEVEFGDAITNAISDDSFSSVNLNSDGTWGFLSAYSPTKQQFDLKINDVWFILAQLKPNSVGRIGLARFIYSDQTLIGGGFIADSTTVYNKITIDKNLKGNFLVTESTAGLMERDFQIAIKLEGDDLLLSADELKNKYASNGYLYFGLNSAQGDVEVVGLNLFDKTKVEIDTTLNSTTGLEQPSVGNFVSSDFRKAIGGKEYAIASNVSGTIRIYWYDSSENYISRDFAGTDELLVISPINAKKFKISNSMTMLEKTQLELGTIATPYQPYKSQKVTTPIMRSLPNGKRDLYNVLSGKFEQVISDKYELVSGDITRLVTGSNIQYVQFDKPISYKYTNSAINTFGSMVLNEYTEKLFADDIGNEFTFSNNGATSKTIIVVPLGTYASLGDAQTDLSVGGANAVKLIYQLATSVKTQIESEQFNLVPKGAINADSFFEIDYKVNLNASSQRNGNTEAIGEVEKESDRKSLENKEGIEVNSTDIGNNTADIGNLSSLTTTNKTSLVNALNEVDGQTDALISAVNVHTTNIDIIRTAQLATGVVNAYIVNTAGTFSRYDGNILNFIPNNDNSGAATINEDGNGVAPIIKYVDGSWISVEKDDLQKFQQASIVWNTSQAAFQLAPKGGGAEANGIISEYLVQAGDDISVGDFISWVQGLEFSTIKKTVVSQVSNVAQIALGDTLGQMDTVQIDSSRVLLIYRGPSDFGNSVVITIIGNAISIGPVFIFNASITIQKSIAKIGINKFMIAYKQSSNLTGYVAVLTVVGTTITSGPRLGFYTSDSSYMHIVRVEDDKTLVSYAWGGNVRVGRAFIAVASNLNVSFGSELEFNNTDDTSYIIGTLIDTNKVLMTYNNVAYEGKAIVLTIMGLVITQGTSFIFNSNRSQFITTSFLETNKVLVSYLDYPGDIVSVVLTISGTNISKGIAHVLSSYGSYAYIAMFSTTINSSNVLVTYTDNSNNNIVTSLIVTISDTTVTKGSKILIPGDSFDSSLSTVLVGSDKVFVALGWSTLNLGLLRITGEPIGVAKTAGIGGSTIEIITPRF